GALKLDHFPGELIDPARHLRITAEHLSLDFVDVVLQAGDYRCVTLDHRIQDRVKDGLGAAAQELGVSLHTTPYYRQVRRLAVPDGEDEVRAGEDVQLAEVDFLDIVEVAGGTQHHEQGVAVAFQLGALMGDDRVLARQLVQLELFGERQ